ncbi:MAG: hypothetical protein RL572_2052 [Pseudomonadota bacterium]|jgi:hypothetical protein
MHFLQTLPLTRTCQPLQVRHGELLRLLERVGLDSFEAMWELPREFVEPINQRRGGWSGVSELALPQQDGATGCWYLKRQEQQMRYSWRHPVGAPTFRYEIDALRLGLQQQWPSVELQAFGLSCAGRRQRALLLTRKIDWQTLASYESRPDDLQSVRAALTAIGRALFALHASGWQHGALFPKHMFVDLEQGRLQLIDFERARRRLFAADAACTDLTQLLRRTQWLEPALLHALLQTYIDQAPRVIARLSRRFPVLTDFSQEFSA